MTKSKLRGLKWKMMKLSGWVLYFSLKTFIKKSHNFTIPKSYKTVKLYLPDPPFDNNTPIKIPTIIMSKLVWAKIWGLNSYFKNRTLEICCSYFVKTNNIRFCLNFLIEFLQWHLQGFSYLASTVLFSLTSFAVVGLLLVSNQICFNGVGVLTE